MYRPIKAFKFQEVKQEIYKLNKNKAPGYDYIDSGVIKCLPNKGIVYLTTIFNSILRISHYPSQWKFAKIIMIPKPNKPENIVSSYRPIFSKLFEKPFKKRLTPILESLKIIPDHQFGFRHQHGTPEQCHRIVNVIRDSLEQKLYCSAVFLDVKQAFDRVWHLGLIFKLKKILPTTFYILFK